MTTKKERKEVTSQLEPDFTPFVFVLKYLIPSATFTFDLMKSKDELFPSDKNPHTRPNSLYIYIVNFIKINYVSMIPSMNCGAITPKFEKV